MERLVAKNQCITEILRFCRSVLLILCFGGLAHGQVVVTDDANTASAFPTKNFGSSIALILTNGANTYIKFNSLKAEEGERQLL